MRTGPGRILLAFRLETAPAYDDCLGYYFTYSADEAESWSVPRALGPSLWAVRASPSPRRQGRYHATLCSLFAIPRTKSTGRREASPSRRAPQVRPSLLLLANGVLLLSGGRPGLFLSASRDGSGRAWEVRAQFCWRCMEDH
jgi:hypothetical protein